MVIKCLVSGFNCLQFGFARNPEKNDSYTFLELFIIACYLYQMPAKMGSYKLSSDFYNSDIMYIKSNETSTAP